MEPRPLTVVLAGAVASALFAMLVVAFRGAPARTAPPPPRPTAPASRPPEPARHDPVIASNFADPDVIRVGATYYAYATNDGATRVPMATASSIGGPWTRLSQDALPALGRWARDGRTWAPEVSARADGTYLLYYTAHHGDSGRQCIGAATATSPAGPFTAIGPDPLICPTGHGGAIDAAAFVDADGARYVLYKSDGERTGRPAALYLQRTTPDGLGLTGPAHPMLTWDARAEPTLVEAPALVRRGGRYVLFYSGGVFFDDTYRTGYATATSITGPYERAPAPLLSTGGYAEKIRGPGGADVVTDESGDHLVFHGILEFLGDRRVRRGMYVADLGWAGARPVARGSPVRYEAEAARFNGARVGLSPAASGGKTATAIDHPGSWVEFDVYAPTSGRYELRTRYGNRTAAPATHRLTVNGATPTSIIYAPHPPATWRTTPPVRVDLHSGWNTLRFHHQSGNTELDHIELT